jgi:hypothetical protein
MEDNLVKPPLSRLSTVREDSQEDDNRTIVQDDDNQSDASDFDVIESDYNSNELNEGISSLNLVHEREREKRSSSFFLFVFSIEKLNIYLW